MAVHGGPDIVTDGLVSVFDASDKVSYSGSIENGVLATWDDLGPAEKNGTISGATYTESTGSIPALKLDQGSSDMITLGAMNSEISTYFTAMLWIYPTNGNGGLINTVTGGSRNGFYFGFYGSYEPTIYTQDSDGGDWGLNCAAAALTANTWNHVCCVMDGTSTGYIYTNGVQKASGGMTNGWNIGGNSLQIGGNFGNWNSNVEFNGNIAYVALYTKALSATEIKYIFDIQRDRFGL